MSNDRDLIKQQRQKWLAERSLERNLTDVGIDKKIFTDSPHSNLLAEITLKLSEKMQKELKQNKEPKLRKEDLQMEKTISKEIETNTCPICYELMVPPKNSPILLFPCGHTFCKVCVYSQNNNSQICKSKNTTSQIQKCPCCRSPVKSSALNISLQNLICVFTNNKHLIDKHQGESEEKKEEDNEDENLEMFRNNLNLCNMRYKILRDERREMKKKNVLLDQNIGIQQNFLNKLYEEKKEVRTKIEKLNLEMDLIGEYINKNEKDLKEIETQFDENNSKILLIEETLGPIQKEKEKYEILIRNFN